MPVIINGSTGISGTDGSAGTPAVQGTDTNTGLFFPATDQIAFAEGGVEAMRLDASGNVGVGTTTPFYRLSVNGVGNFYSGAAGLGRIFLGDPVDNSGYIGVYRSALGPSNSNTAGNALNFASIDGYTFSTGGVAFGSQTERMRINASGNVGIGTVSPTQRLQVRQDQNATTSILIQNRNASGTPSAALQFISGAFDLADNRYAMILSDGGPNTTLQFYTGQGATPVERARITSGGDFQFNSGYGSVATAFACRAWVNFNGTGTVAIRASGNVSSITDNGNGDYTANFTNAMPDANYVAFHFAGDTIASNANGRMSYGQAKTTTGYRFIGLRDFSGNVLDTPENSVAVFR